jgi:flagellar hook-associated protein 3 FlgL
MTLIRTTFIGRLNANGREVSKLGARLGLAQIQAASGIKYNRASDDVGRVSRLHGLREHLADQTVFEENATWSFGMMTHVDNALEEMKDVLTKARELAVQLGSESYNDQDRIDGAVTAQGLMDQLVQLGNSEVNGRYLFAGFAWDAAAFDAAGVYQGDTGDPSVEVASGVNAATSFDGSALLQGTTDIFAEVSALVAALATGNATNVRAQIDGLESSVEQIGSAFVTAGYEANKADDALTLAQNLTLALTEQVSDIEDADQVETYTLLAQLKTAYEASLQVTSASRSDNLCSRL